MRFRCIWMTVILGLAFSTAWADEQRSNNVLDNRFTIYGGSGGCDKAFITVQSKTEWHIAARRLPVDNTVVRSGFERESLCRTHVRRIKRTVHELGTQLIATVHVSPTRESGGIARSQAATRREIRRRKIADNSTDRDGSDRSLHR